MKPASLHTIDTTDELRREILIHRRATKTIALVPTMGNLHSGHLKLFEAARQQADIVVGSIFVNPMQFGANEDLDAYPRTLQQDQKLLEQVGCNYLFTPSVQEIYPDGPEHHTAVTVPDVAENFCGTSRPGHFRGVATIVTKLFNMVQPDSAFFGLKDYQQYLVIKKFTQDLALPISIHGVATEREPSGLALSSRNQYLTRDERPIAPELQAQLQRTANELRAGATDIARLETTAKSHLQSLGFQPDYFAICQAQTLLPATAAESELVILAAAYLGQCRLIDNIRLTR